MNVLLAPHGSRGDLQPMLALAHALVERGHAPSFVAPSNFVDWIRAHGFAAEANGIDVAQVLQSAGADLHSLRWQIRHLGELTTTLFDAVARASRDAALIVTSGVQMAGPSVAEWRGVPCASVVFCPCVLPSAATPPPPIKTQTLPRWINRLLWDVGGPMASWALAPHLNRGRAALGLPPIGAVLSHLAGNLTIVAADPDLAPLADDVPPNVTTTDAFVLERDLDAGGLDVRIERFIDQQPPPVYVGFGSMVAKDVPALAAAAIEAVRAVGRRALVAGGWAGLARFISPADDVLVAETVPHDRVFPRVAAAVHHGGAGTTTAAARAGVPQVVLPHILDQYYWAHRVAELGLGPSGLAADVITTDLLADRIDAAANDPAFRSRAELLRPRIAARNGAAAAAAQLERLVAGAVPSA